MMKSAASPPDRLRWCRLHMGLLQREVAELVGIATPLYIDMETGACEHTPAAVMDRLAELYGVLVTDLLDGYNRFLYEGQARQILAIRQRAGLSRAAFARKTASAKAPSVPGRRRRKPSARSAGNGTFGN